MTSDAPGLLVAFMLGIGLSAAVGFRVFLPMLLVGLGGKLGLLHLASGFDWLQADLALVVFAVAAGLEIGAYFFPWLDNLLDMVAQPAAVIAGTVLMASAMFELAPWLRWIVAVIAGGGTAGLLRSATAGVRLGSTAATGGLVNPVLASVETGVSTVLTVLAVVVPVLAFILVVGLLLGVRRLVRRVFRRGG